jgi:predicted dehydrogenase/aryl-alcohol dehydrogenase-like predicted oxidoreductase
MAKLKWGIIGAGRIARAFARGVAHSETGELIAIGSRGQKSADKFGDEFGLQKRHVGYESLLADPEVEAVYIATPHPMHAEWAIKAAEAKKHILCEKPIGLNHAETMAIVEAAYRNDVFLMEAFMYRCHPQIARLIDLIRDRAIGEVKLIQATFGFQSRFDPEARLFKNALGGGGTLDVGCYAMSMSRLVAGAAQGKDFADPTEVRAVGHLGETGVDEYTVASAKFPGEIVAQLATAVTLQEDNVVRVFGTGGNILIPTPWIPNREGGSATIVVHRHGQEAEEITIESPGWLYGLEADMVGRNIARRQATPPAMTWDDTLGNMKGLDMWREAIGLTYDAEKFDAPHPPVARRPPAARADNVMKYGEVAGVGKRVSRLVMGCDNQRTMAHASVMFDDYFERGGNCFDTSYIYGGGLQERLLGQWIRNRGIREQVVIIAKNAHTPECFPDRLRTQLIISLERMKTDYTDLLIAHRDNPEVPIAEFVDAFNAVKAEGLAHAFGGSNWSLARVQAFNENALARGLSPMAVVSNNFSLAQMMDPVWSGCIAASDPESRAWFEKTQMPLFAWSSQARGFFTDRAGRDKKTEPELVRCWYSEENFQRRDGAYELARKKGVPPITIALAYVLAQPFPTFPLIGPRQLSETRTSFEALSVDLTPEEVRWLNLEG